MRRKFMCGLLVAVLTWGILGCSETSFGEETEILENPASPYVVEVDLTSQVVTVYDAGTHGEDNIVRQMICSSGMPGGEDATPCGDFVVKQHYPDERSQWYYIDQYGVYVQYVTRFNGPYLFHSLPYFEKSVASIDTLARSQLGQPVSHGCIRLRSEDAQWLALNCPDGTPVHVFESQKVDEELRTQLLKRGYDRSQWSSYDQYRTAEISPGLTGALEQLIRQGETS